MELSKDRDESRLAEFILRMILLKTSSLANGLKLFGRFKQPKMKHMGSPIQKYLSAN